MCGLENLTGPTRLLPCRQVRHVCSAEGCRRPAHAPANAPPVAAFHTIGNPALPQPEPPKECDFPSCTSCPPRCYGRARASKGEQGLAWLPVAEDREFRAEGRGRGTTQKPRRHEHQRTTPDFVTFRLDLTTVLPWRLESSDRVLPPQQSSDERCCFLPPLISLLRALLGRRMEQAGHLASTEAATLFRVLSPAGVRRAK
jgi:hypothetical protein